MVIQELITHMVFTAGRKTHRIERTTRIVWIYQWASYQIKKIRIAHAPGMLGMFSPPLRVTDPDIHHGTCVMHVRWCMSGSLTSSFLWSRWRGKLPRLFRPVRNQQFRVSGKRPTTPPTQPSLPFESMHSVKILLLISPAYLDAIYKLKIIVNEYCYCL